MLMAIVRGNVEITNLLEGAMYFKLLHNKNRNRDFCIDSRIVIGMENGRVFVFLYFYFGGV